MATNFAGVSDSISGPVGVVAAGAEAAKQDPAGLFQFAAIINVNLAVINMLPLPVRLTKSCGCACRVIMHVLGAGRPNTTAPARDQALTEAIV